MSAAIPLLLPEWRAPAGVRAFTTTRVGGVSAAPFDSFNLATHVGDAPQAVAENRRRLRALLPAEPLWLEQVHGCAVADAASTAPAPVADAVIARAPGAVCAVMTADCLPVLLCDDEGSVVAAAHAGWRGLCEGVLEATVARMAVPAAGLQAWLGPAIGARAFEVGDEVRAAFLVRDGAAAQAFSAGPVPGKWFADLCLLARQRLAAAGVLRVSGGQWCTHADSARFYSFRRDGACGRMATLIWLAEQRRGR